MSFGDCRQANRPAAGRLVWRPSPGRRRHRLAPRQSPRRSPTLATVAKAFGARHADVAKALARSLRRAGDLSRDTETSLGDLRQTGRQRAIFCLSCWRASAASSADELVSPSRSRAAFSSTRLGSEEAPPLSHVSSHAHMLPCWSRWSLLCSLLWPFPSSDSTRLA